MSARFSREEQLLCLLNRAKLSDSELARARTMASENLDWRVFGDLALQNGTTLLTWLRLEELAIPLSPELEPLHDQAQALRVAGEQRQEDIDRLLEQFHQAGIAVIVLKGALFGETLYGRAVYKKMNDLDVLVSRADTERTLSLLKNNGLTSIGALFGEKEISRRTHHAPPFVTSNTSCVVGVHWGLRSPLSPYKVDLAQVWKDAVSISLGRTFAWRMSWEDNLLHLCIHLPFFKTGLRELADVSNLCLFSSPRLDWNAFAKRVEAARAEDAVYRVLTLARELIPFAIPEDLLALWKSRSSKLTVSDTRSRAQSPAVLLRSRSTHVAQIEKAFSIFRLSGNYRERVRALVGMWALTLFPANRELPRLLGTSSDALPSFARPRAAAKIWTALAREIGHGPLVFVTGINLVKLAHASVLRLFGRDGASLANHPARKLLEVLE